ncbi:RNA-binding protein [Hirschfeldia incana]|nr:RNA-binding protein [Hirschfeldia incana]
MKKPIPKIRVFGQRSIAPSFLNRTTIPEKDSSSKKVDKCASFSEFLDSKLNNSVLFKPSNVEDKTQISHGFGMERKARSDKNANGGLEKTMLRQFKPRETQISSDQVIMSRDVTGRADDASLEPLDQTTAEEVDLLTTCFTEINDDDHIIVKDDKLSKKRKDPFEGMESIDRTRKPVLVFGDNSSKVSKSMREEGERGSNSTRCKKQKPSYNHYANGSGFWDRDMEGVDSEEVGHSEVWEGVGSTTFGDIVDWH